MRGSRIQSGRVLSAGDEAAGGAQKLLKPLFGGGPL